MDEQFIDYDAIAADLTMHDYLDSAEITDSLLELHEMLADGGFDPESIETYKLMITVLTIITNLSIQHGPVMSMEWLGRIATRAYRDLKARG